MVLVHDGRQICSGAPVRLISASNPAEGIGPDVVSSEQPLQIVRRIRKGAVVQTRKDALVHFIDWL